MTERPREVLIIPRGIPAAKLARLMEVADELWPDCEVAAAAFGDSLKVTWIKPEPPKPTGLAALFAPRPSRQCGAVDETGLQCIRHADHENSHASIDDFGVPSQWDDEPEPEASSDECAPYEPWSDTEWAQCDASNEDGLRCQGAEVHLTNWHWSMHDGEHVTWDGQGSAIPIRTADVDDF